MPIVSMSIDVKRPPEAAFEVVADPVRRRLLLPDNFADFRVVSETSEGPGTRTSFRIVTPQGEHRAEVEVTAWDPPRALTETALGDSPYTIRWRFDPTPTGARVTAEMEYPPIGSILHRLVERWFARRALQQSLLLELIRLKQQVER